MIFTLTIASLSALSVRGNKFNVEQLTREGSSYSYKFIDHTVYFNYLDEVRAPDGCSDVSGAIAVAVAGGSTPQCRSLGKNSTAKFSLIKQSFSSPVQGVRASYTSSDRGTFVIDVMCSRMQIINMTATSPKNYLVTWSHPAGCPQKSMQKSFFNPI
ncbi:hypothetical protein BLNAU_6676 [Blattamonas nauphoetae]|uniref:Uncharacterized protein n=1 Tax=Blattamonas nauphoetae TaxID=2049346 RepID=A0ABQ9Y3T1_9EUKA|nr:hypothetical protein BLNAU_6676 [Blattamonas nauphoetae]